VNLWILHQKKQGARHTLQHYYRIMTRTSTNHWQVTLPFCFNCSHILPVNHHYVQRIVQATGPQSMNVGTWCKNYWQFLLCKVSNIRSHSCATVNQHLRCSSKEGKQDTKVTPWCMYCGWWKGTSRAEATSNGEKNEPIALAIVE